MGQDEGSRFIPLDELIEIDSAEVPIETLVKQRYDELAAGGQSNLCCSPDVIYTAEELAGIPETVLTLSSGCGAPIKGIDLQPGQTVLDLGCGAGLDILLAARKVAPDGRAIGVDASLNMIKVARRAAADAHIANAEFRVGDIRRLPVRDQMVDVVLSNCVIAMFPNKAEVYSEVARVLRPSGYVVISDVLSGTVDDHASQQAQADQWSACVVGISEAEYEALLKECGFGLVEFRDRKHVPYRDGQHVTSVRIVAYKDPNFAQQNRCCQP